MIDCIYDPNWCLQKGIADDELQSIKGIIRCQMASSSQENDESISTFRRKQAGSNFNLVMQTSISTEVLTWESFRRSAMIAILTHQTGKQNSSDFLNAISANYTWVIKSPRTTTAARFDLTTATRPSRDSSERNLGRRKIKNWDSRDRVVVQGHMARCRIEKNDNAFWQAQWKKKNKKK